MKSKTILLINDSNEPIGPIPFEQLKAEMFTYIAHGDKEHRDWLKEAISNFFDGKPKPVLVQPKDTSKIIPKGTTVIIHSCTHMVGSDSSYEETLEEDTSEDTLMDMAEEYANETHQLEWSWQVKK